MTSGVDDPLWTAMRAAGGLPTRHHDRTVIAHFGNPAAEYVAATTRAAVFSRSHRGRVIVNGRDPGRMLNGILTGTLPSTPRRTELGLLGGSATYQAVLTPKGKMVTDLWCFRFGDETAEAFLLDVPEAGRDGLMAHLLKVLPPRFASAEDVTEQTAMLSVVGPQASAAVSRFALGLRVDAVELDALDEGVWTMTGETVREGLVVVKTSQVWPPAFDVMGPRGAIAALWASLSAGGVVPGGLNAWSTLRVEAGRPAFGADMDLETIPAEAGIQERAIDHQKGCYTGQEVIVRIRDRGHVNRHLRLLKLGSVPVPPIGTELRASGDDGSRAVGWITSSVESPRFAETIALAYVRRGVETVFLDGRAIPVSEG